MENVPDVLQRLDDAFYSNPLEAEETALTKRRRSRMEELLDKYVNNEAPVASGAEVSDNASRVCRPWNYQDFQRRLRSFDKSYNWFAKPDHLSPLQAASRGWTNVGLNKLACLACNAEYEHSEQVFAGQTYSSSQSPLIAAHTEACGWRNAACAPSFSLIPGAEDEDSLQIKRITDSLESGLITVLACDLLPWTVRISDGPQPKKGLVAIQIAEEASATSATDVGDHERAPESTTYPEEFTQPLDVNSYPQSVEISEDIESAQQEVNAIGNTQLDQPNDLEPLSKEPQQPTSEETAMAVDDVEEDQAALEAAIALSLASATDPIEERAHNSESVGQNGDPGEPESSTQIEQAIITALASEEIPFTSADTIAKAESAMDVEQSEERVNSIIFDLRDIQSHPLTQSLSQLICKDGPTEDPEDARQILRMITPSYDPEAVTALGTLLSICGWGVHGSSAVLHCEVCQRAVALADFINDESKQPPILLNPLQQHRPFCPWVTLSSVSSSGDDRSVVPGWRLCAQQVQRGVRMAEGQQNRKRRLSHEEVVGDRQEQRRRSFSSPIAAASSADDTSSKDSTSNVDVLDVFKRIRLMLQA